MSKNLQQWLDDYGVCHQHPLNKRIHWLCVPLIVWSLLALLWLLPLPMASLLPALLQPLANVATLLIAVASIYYWRLAPRLALGMLLFSALALWAGMQLAVWLALPSWLLPVVVFVLAWIGQFIGHHIEGKKPSFFKDLQYLLIGPVWCLEHLYRRLGVGG
ncbi:MAG: DUF962 domain-containing protein [Gammaproteobacteria bacterium]|nr:DUF962 domain-containing protein [Gammaproteobacteria bacterium]